MHALHGVRGAFSAVQSFIFRLDHLARFRVLMHNVADYKVQLLVSEWCTPCRAAEAVWRKVAERRQITFEVLDMAQPEARALAQRLYLRTVPAVVINDKLQGVGVQSLQEALALVAGAPERTPSATRFVGMTLEASSRVALISSGGYLLPAAVPLGLEGTLYGGSTSPAFLHIFTLGFITFMIFGLGEHMLPRFTGKPIRMGVLVWTQIVLAHAGLWGLVAGLLLRERYVLLFGGMLALLALAIFAARILPLIGTRTETEAKLDEAGGERS